MVKLGRVNNFLFTNNGSITRTKTDTVKLQQTYIILKQHTNDMFKLVLSKIIIKY